MDLNETTNDKLIRLYQLQQTRAKVEEDVLFSPQLRIYLVDSMTAEIRKLIKSINDYSGV